MTAAFLEPDAGRGAARAGASALAIVTLAWLLSGLIAAALAAPGLVALDTHVAMALHAAAGRATWRFMRLVSLLHGTAPIVAGSAVLAAGLAARRRWNALPLLLAGVPGGLLLNAALKTAVHRARPTWTYAAEHLTSYSFPSGHVAGATVFYGLIVVLAWPHRSPAQRGGLLTAAAAAVLLVAASRITLGAHYFSDCVAGALVGTLWIAVCVQAFGWPERPAGSACANTKAAP